MNAYQGRTLSRELYNYHGSKEKEENCKEEVLEEAEINFAK